MSDDLAHVIHRAFRDAVGTGSVRHVPSLTRCQQAATAVRSYLLSEERVEAAAVSMASEVHFSFKGFDERTQSKYLRQARAALSAAIGGDDDAQPLA